jgi:hypothetical protein
MVSHERQENFSRTCWMTFHDAGHAPASRSRPADLAADQLAPVPSTGTGNHSREYDTYDFGKPRK